jgi:hypothetical protein
MAAELIRSEEAVLLGATDSIFFSHYFFPDVCRQESPPMHRDLWELFEHNRYSNAQMYRGSSKTSIARMFTAKRIAYGFSHTLLYIGKSESHAILSVEWLKQQIEYNHLFARTFGLSPGDKWTAGDIEILHGTDKYPIRVMALGSSGSIRGVNVKGHRPDTIVVDDPCDEENTATPEQRQKLAELFFGGIKESLVPASEDPTACLALLQTPLAVDDLTDLCYKSEEFKSLRYGILDNESEELANPTWPQRWTKEEILKEKHSAIQRNQLSIWMREKMCTMSARETCEFRAEWLKYWEVLPPNPIIIGAIDPAPVLSDAARMKNAQTDLQAIMVCAYWRGNKYVLEYETARDQDPDAVAKAIERLGRKYQVRRWGVEGVAYQRTLKWFLEREMQAGRMKHVRIVELGTKGQGIPKGKTERIIQAHSGRASSGCLFVHKDHYQFIEDFTNFPNIKYKDLLDVSAMCDMTLSPRAEQGADYLTQDDDDTPALEWKRAAP